MTNINSFCLYNHPRRWALLFLSFYGRGNWGMVRQIVPPRPYRYHMIKAGFEPSNPASVSLMISLWDVSNKHQDSMMSGHITMMILFSWKGNQGWKRSKTHSLYMVNPGLEPRLADSKAEILHSMSFRDKERWPFPQMHIIKWSLSKSKTTSWATGHRF